MEKMENTVQEINMFALRHLVVAVIKQLKTLPFQSRELYSLSLSKLHSNSQLKNNAHSVTFMIILVLI